MNQYCFSSECKVLWRIFTKGHVDSSQLRIPQSHYDLVLLAELKSTNFIRYCTDHSLLPSPFCERLFYLIFPRDNNVSRLDEVTLWSIGSYALAHIEDCLHELLQAAVLSDFAKLRPR